MHERLEVAATLDDLLDRSSVTQAPAIPSHFTLAQAEGFALSMAKMSLTGHIDEVATIESNLRNI